MNYQELIERYIYAVVKHLPGKIRSDVSKELKTLIDDMLEERCGNMSVTEKDIRIVLTELGSPEDLAQNYNPAKSSYLIGPRYYSNYKTVLFIVLISTLGGMLVSGIVTMFIDSVTLPGMIELCKWFAMCISGIVYAFGFVTLLFAFFERKGIDANIAKLNLDELPAVPKKQERIGKWDPIVGIIFSVIFLIVFLVIPQIFCVFSLTESLSIPIFDLSVLRSVRYLLIALFMLGIIKESFKIYEGRYTKRLAVVTLITNALTLLLTYLFVSTKGLMNPELIPYVTGIFDGSEDTQFIISLFARFPLLFLGVIVFALLLDSITTLVKGFSYDKKEL